MERVGLMGLGTMGAGMGTRLLRAGFPLAVYNRTKERAAGLMAQGAEWAPTPSEVALGADVVLAMVADDQASRGLWLGETGALRTLSAEAVAIDCSTLSLGWVNELAQAVRQRRASFLDAPVTGSKPQAESGELQFLVGGEASALERARPVLRAMSRDIVHLGATGSGALLKLVNNFLCGVQAASLAEAMVLLERSDLDFDAALGVLCNGAPGSPLLKTLSVRMRAQDYRVNFTLQLMQKDLTYARAEARSRGLSTHTISAALDVFEHAREGGWGDKDFSSVVEGLR